MLLLVESGADVEAVDCYGMRALHLAVIYYHEDMARFLLSQGAQVNAQDRISLGSEKY